MASRLAESTALALERDLAGFPGGRLPPYSALADRYGVSVPTVALAIHLLARKGVIETHRGRRARCAAAGPEPVVPSLSSPERLAASFRDGILAGTYRAGQALPKVTYLSASLGLSRSTVVGAMRVLAAGGLVHKQGKRWLVGRSRGGALEPGPSPVILIVQPHASVWAHLARGHAADFRAVFAAEARACGVALDGCVWDTEARPSFSTPRGPREIAARIRELGYRLAGAVVVGIPGEYGDFGAALATVLGNGRRVVWFDRRNDAPPLPRVLELARCTQSEEAFGTEAIEYLFARRHRSVLYLGLDYEPWQQERGAMIRARGQKFGVAVSVMTPAMAMREIMSMDLDTCASRLVQLGQRGAEPVARLVAFLLRALEVYAGALPPGLCTRTPHHRLADFLQNWPRDPHSPIEPFWYMREFARCLLAAPAATAVIAPRDAQAGQVLIAMAQAGLAVPADLSLISYDNASDVTELPVTSVDRGFGNLAYRAFHWLIDDVDVHCEANGDIVARPEVVDRGTVGFAGEGAAGGRELWAGSRE